MFASYEFVGVLNLFNLCPDFLYPVYKQNDQLYFHNGRDNVIYNFDPITKSVHDRIIFLDSGDIEIVNEANKLYCEKYAPVYVFQESEKKIFCAQLNGMIKYLYSFDTTDTILKKQIDKFIDENSSSDDLFLDDDVRALPSTLGINPYESYFSNFNDLILKKLHEKSGIFPYEKRELQNYNIFHFTEKETDNLDVYIPNAVPWRRIKHNIFQKEANSNILYDIGDTSPDFNALKKSFDTIIKNISYNDYSYNICIKCLNAIIHKDEKELKLLIRTHHRVFIRLQNSQLLDEYLIKYIQLRNSFFSIDYK